MITEEQYYRGYDRVYARELTDEIRSNVKILISKVNELIRLMAKDGIELETNPITKSGLNSGWRPPAVNARTKNAAVRSNHMTGKAVDLYDPEGEIDEWCIANLDALKRLGLYMEHPSATKGWCHLQSTPPRSGRQVFYP